MRKVMVDSNVLFSSLLFRGNPYKILELIEKQKIRLILPIDELNEVYSVFKRKVSDKIFLLDTFLLIAKPKIVSDREYISFISEASKLVRDKGDIPILACALAIKPNCFITGDSDFHTKGIIRRVNVVTPNEFLKKIGKDWLSHQ